MTQRTVNEAEANDIAYEAYRLSQYLQKNPDTKTIRDTVIAMQAMGYMNNLFVEALLLSLVGSLRPVSIQ